MRLVNVSRREANGRRDVTVKATGLFRLESLDMRDGQLAYPRRNRRRAGLERLDPGRGLPGGARHTGGPDGDYGLDPKPLEQEGLIAVLTHLERDPLQRAEILEGPNLEEMQLRLKQHLELAVQILTQNPKTTPTFFVN